MAQKRLFFFLLDTVCETEFATNMTFKVVTSILNFYIPTTIITFLYMRIFFAIKRRSRDIVRFGAYTASGRNTTNTEIGGKCSKKTANNKSPTNIEKDECKSLTLKNSLPDGLKQNGTSKSILQIQEDQSKMEFHRLAVVALPLEEKSTPQIKREQNNCISKSKSNQGKVSRSTGKLERL